MKKARQIQLWRGPQVQQRKVVHHLGALSLLLATAIFPLACRKQGPTGPSLSATDSLEAQKDLRSLQEQWEIKTEMGRRELRPSLESYIEKYGTDPSVAKARILLSQIALLDGRFSEAEQILLPVSGGPQGSARDEATVILAAIDNRRGAPEKALARLEPLAGKLLTREAKDQYSRERSRAAIDARRWRLALSVMVTWLLESGSESAQVKKWIASAVDDVPNHALSRLMVDFERETTEKKETAAREWVLGVLVSKLSEEALAKRDPSLARDLLADAPPWLRGTKDGQALSLLASTAEKNAQVTGRAIGVVLGGKTEDERRRSIRFASGVMRGLGLGRADGPRKVRYIAVEDRGSLTSALSTLTGLGASVLIAGTDEASASEALAFAESRKVPVIALSEPDTVRKLHFGFVFGVGRKEQKTVLPQLLPGVENWIFVGEGEFACPQALDEAESNPFPIGLWKEQGVDGLGLLGDGSCTKAFLSELQGSKWTPSVVVGLEAAHDEFFQKQKQLKLTVGAFPLPNAEFTEGPMSSMEKSIARGERLPAMMPQSDWFFTLGMDLARLVEGALLTLPDTEVTREAEVRERHDQVRVALETVQAPLVSTNARSFSAEHLIARDFSLSGASSGMPLGGSR